MVLTVIYYMYRKESFVGRTAMKIGQSRMAMALVAVDAVCWGALVFLVFTFLHVEDKMELAVKVVSIIVGFVLTAFFAPPIINFFLGMF